MKAWNGIFLHVNCCISPKHFFFRHVYSNPCKTLLLGTNYLTVINLSSLLEFYWCFGNALHENQPKERLYQLMESCITPLFELATPSVFLSGACIFSGLLKVANFATFKSKLKYWVELGQGQPSARFCLRCPFNLTENPWEIFLRLVYQTVVHPLHGDYI